MSLRIARIWRGSRLLAVQYCATIAIGMGAATALVSLLLALGYERMPFRSPEQLVAIWLRPESGDHAMGISGPDLTDLAGATQSTFSSLGPFAPFWLWGIDDRGTTKLRVRYLQARTFSDLGLRPVLGREVRLDDLALSSGRMPGALPPAWLSYEFWQLRYGGSPSVIGKRIQISSSPLNEHSAPVQIVGVLPRRSALPHPHGMDGADVWYLMESDLATRPRAASTFLALGRLRPAATATQAQAALDVVVQRLALQYPHIRGKRVVVRTLEDMAQGPARQTMGILVSGVALVFLVACLNLAILMAAEGRRRWREIAVRAALGASRLRLWREVALEKCLLTLFSLALGVALAIALVRVLAWLVPAAGLGAPLEQLPPLNLATQLGFGAIALGMCLVWSALLVTTATSDGTAAARALCISGGPGYTGLSDRSPRAGLFSLLLPAGQAGTGICLLAATAMAVGTYTVRSAANLGPAPQRTVLLSLDLRSDVLASEARTADFDRQVLSELERLPATESVALVDYFPPPADPRPFVKEGDNAGVERTTSLAISVTPSYFRIFGIPILYGRGFDSTDTGQGEMVAIISLDMAQKNWASPKDAVGAVIQYGSRAPKRLRIIGVAGNFTGYWAQKPFPMVYWTESQQVTGASEVILRTTASPESIAALVRKLFDGKRYPAAVREVSTMQARWRETVTRPLARMAGMLLLGLLGLALCIQGVYAVAAGTVAARSHELAVCSALGALPGQLAWRVTHTLIAAVTAGAVLGVSATLWFRPVLTRWLGTPTQWEMPAIAVAAILLALAAAAGCWFPARSAMRMDPVELLRQG